METVWGTNKQNIAYADKRDTHHSSEQIAHVFIVGSIIVELIVDNQNMECYVPTMSVFSVGKHPQTVTVLSQFGVKLFSESNQISVKRCQK